MLALLALRAFAIATTTLSAGEPPEWGGFRGNNGCGVSASEKIPDALAVDANAQWRTEVPPGYSSPVVTKNDVLLTAAEGEQLATLCMDRHTGEVRWRRDLEFDGKRPGMNSPAAPSPVTDGERVVVLFHSFGLVAYDLEGKELWRRPLGPFHIPHGMSTSPLLHGELVLLLVDQNVDSYLAAFDKLTGEERWRVARPGVAHGYSTPSIHAPAEGPAQLIVSGSYQISAYSVADGAKLWWVDGAAWQTKAVPVFHGDLCFVNAYMPPSSEFGVPRMSQTWKEALAERDKDGDGKIAKDEWQHEMMHDLWFIFDLDGDGLLGEKDYEYAASSASATGGLFAIRLGGKGDVTASHIAWKSDDRRGLPDAPSPLLLDGTLYMICEGGVFTALDPATGAVIKQGRVGKPDPYYASPVGAAGHIVVASQSGQLGVIRAGREWEAISFHDLGEEVWSTPAIAGEQVFVRSQEALYCFQD